MYLNLISNEKKINKIEALTVLKVKLWIALYYIIL